jgi:hypothetical protein
MAGKGFKSNAVALFGGTMLGISPGDPRVRQPAFFRGETIILESAQAMRPREHLVS